MFSYLTLSIPVPIKMQPADKINIMTNEESYVQRRLLFKNIWETAMDINEKDDIINKPKVIKTLRLDEVDKCVVGKTKKQRIKNLRHVCNRILDFCDRHDAEDVFYEQFAVAGGQERSQAHKIKAKSPKKKSYKGKRKVKKAKSMFGYTNRPTILMATTSELTSPKVKSPGIKKQVAGKIITMRAKRKVKSKQSPVERSEALELISVSNNPKVTIGTSIVRRKTFMKKHSKRK